MSTERPVESIEERLRREFGEPEPAASNGSHAAPIADPTAPVATGTAAQALADSRVDLVAAIEAGIPAREFIPGGEGWLIVGKRYLFVSRAGEGKSLFALIQAVEVVAAGGTVGILDVENGSDEYARRLADVLEARDPDGSLAAACADRLRYYEWPPLRTVWGATEWATAFAGVDLVIFDSSRLMLSAAGLAEDSNDDFAEFASSLLTPLSRAGVTTALLDNTGHSDDRARGASAKRDLNEVVYSVKTGEDFDRGTTGHLRLVRDRTRFSDLPPELHVPIGGGVYGPPAVADPQPDADGWRPTLLMERVSLAIEQTPGASTNEATAAVKGKTDAKREALRLLVAEGYVEVEQVGKARRHTVTRPYRAAEDQGTEGAEND